MQIVLFVIAGFFFIYAMLIFNKLRVLITFNFLLFPSQFSWFSTLCWSLVYMFGYLKLRAKELVEKKSTLGQFL